MKLRKIGNSFGTTFSQDALSKAGFTEDVELDVIAVRDEIIIRPALPNGYAIEFTPSEAKAIAREQLGTKSGQAAVQKIRRLLDYFKDETIMIPNQIIISMQAQTAKLITKRRSLLAEIQSSRDISGNVHPKTDEITILTRDITTRLGNAALEAIEDGRNTIYPG